jgi:hypothetical protein
MAACEAPGSVMGTAMGRETLARRESDSCLEVVYGRGCGMAREILSCVACVYNDPEPRGYIGQPARTVADISDRPHAADATLIRLFQAEILP